MIKDFIIAHASQQRICLTCASDWEKYASQQQGILKLAFGDNIMGRTQNLRGFHDLHIWLGKGGGAVFTVFDLSGRPYTGRMKSNVEDVCTVINKDRRITVSKTAPGLGISYGISQGVAEYATDLREVVCVFSTTSRITSFFGRCSMGVVSAIGDLFSLR